MEELLEYIVKKLVSKPDEVKIKAETESGVINLILNVAPDDMGIIIGKGGATIRAIRKLLVARMITEDRNMRVNLNLQEV